jgi:hypothetical protein
MTWCFDRYPISVFSIDIQFWQRKVIRRKLSSTEEQLSQELSPVNIYSYFTSSFKGKLSQGPVFNSDLSTVDTSRAST